MKRTSQAPWPFPIFADGRNKRHCGCEGCARYRSVMAGEYTFAEYPETLAPHERTVPFLGEDGKQIRGLIIQKYTREEVRDQFAWLYGIHSELVKRKRKDVIRLNGPMI